MSHKRLLARPKGKHTFPVTIALTQEQIDFLKTQPNASELIRHILDDLIASRKDIEEKLGVISLNHELQALNKELNKLGNERGDYSYKNIVYDSKMNPKAKDESQSSVVIRVLKGYDEAMDSLKQKIEDIKKQITEKE